MIEKQEYTILVIDDNPVNLRLLCSLLQTHGYDVIPADGGRDGLDRAKSRRPDLILLDIIMPDMDGYEVCRHLKDNPFLKSIPVLMVSGEHEAEAKVRCFELGAADYITKPYNQREILARIQTHLRLRQLTRTLEEANDRLVRKKHILDQDLKSAAEIQKALLPKHFPGINSASFSFIFKPCERISGDIFNVQILDEQHLGIYILDVSGHGVPAAMLTALAHQSLLPQSGIIKQCLQGPPYYRLLSPAAVYRLLEDEFPIERFDRYFTMAYLVLNILNGKFTYSCAGHPPILQISQGGEIIRHHQGGAMVGIGFLGGERTEGKGQLKNGDRLVFYTDGIIENENNCGHPYGLEKFEQFLSENSNMDIDTVSEKLMENLSTFSGNVAFQDDITLLAMEWCG